MQKVQINGEEIVRMKVEDEEGDSKARALCAGSENLEPIEYKPRIRIKIATYITMPDYEQINIHVIVYYGKFVFLVALCQPIPCT